MPTLPLHPSPPQPSPPGSPFTLLTSLSPITSIAFLSHTHILSGSGSFLTSYPLASSQPPTKRRLFPRERIHGILPLPCNSRVLVYGSRRIRLCSATWLCGETDDDTSSPELPLLNDWVLTAALLKDGTIIAVGTNNIIYLLSPGARKWEERGCGERTMLYSADLKIEGDEVTVIAGTVFGEIVIWRVRIGGKEEEEGRIMRRIRGHEGSIFGVRLHSGGRWLVSCSDDRTVRLWDLSTGGVVEEGPSSTGMGAVARDATGAECVSVGWGHQARVWKVGFVEDEDERKVKMVSVSEDLSARFWEWSTEAKEEKMGNTKTVTMHAGKNVWCFDIDPKRKLLATGGNDARVCVLDYADDRDERLEFGVDEVLSGLLDLKDGAAGLMRKGKGKVDNWRNYAIVDDHRFVATTEAGRVLLYDLDTNAWKLLGQWEGLRNWGHSTAWEGSGLIALGDSQGRVRIIDVNSSHSWSWEADGVGRKVDGVFACGVEEVETSDGDLPTRVYHILTTSLGPQPYILHSFSLPTSPSSEPIRSIITLQKPHPKCTLTSALYVPSTRTLYTGTRTGNLLLYTLPSSTSLSSPSASSSSSTTTDPIPPTSSHRSLYTPDALTSLSLPHPTTLTSTSRSGHHAIHLLSPTTGHLLKPLHISKPTPSISHLEGSSSNSVYGFRALNFICHDLTTGLDTLSVPCGGAHRSWAYHHASGTLLWTQAGKLQILRPRKAATTQDRIRVLAPGYHGREIKAADYSPSTGLLATGAEDTLIRLSRPDISRDGRLIGTLWPEKGGERATTVKAHTTGVIDLCWAPGGERLLSTGGAEELMIWRVGPIAGGIGVVKEAELEAEGEREVRFVGVACEECEGGLMVAVGTSDGVIKLLRYTPPDVTLSGTDSDETDTTARDWEEKEKLREGKFETVKEWKYGVICVTQIAFIKSSDKLWVVAAATDGCVFAYPAHSASSSSSNDPIWRERVHQNTVKSLTILPPSTTSSSIRILTGGDDGAIGELTIELDEKGIRTLGKNVVEEAHAGAVVGVLETEGKVVSVGNEGRVKVWRGVEEEGYVGEVDGGVSDQSGAVVVKEGWVGVFGVGWEVWRL